MAILKKKSKYLKVGEVFLQVYIYIYTLQYSSIYIYIYIYKHLNIDVVNILMLFFWLMEFDFIIKIIRKHLKSDIIVGDIFGVLFQV